MSTDPSIILETLMWDWAKNKTVVKINGHVGALNSATNGIATMQGVRKYFDYSLAVDTGEAKWSAATKSLTIGEQYITDMDANCTCDIDPKQCCDED